MYVFVLTAADEGRQCTELFLQEFRPANKNKIFIILILKMLNVLLKETKVC